MRGVRRPAAGKKMVPSSISTLPLRFLARGGRGRRGAAFAPNIGDRWWLQRRESPVDGELGFGLGLGFSGARGEREGAAREGTEEGAGQGVVVFLTQHTARRGGPGRRGGSAVPAGRGGDRRGRFCENPLGIFLFSVFLPFPSFLSLFFAVFTTLSNSKI